MKESCKGISKSELLSLIDDIELPEVITIEMITEIFENHSTAYVECANNKLVPEHRLDMIGKELTFIEALDYALCGYFVTNELFDDTQSMHHWADKFYYEDGAVVRPNELAQEDWAVTRPWRIIAIPEMIDINKLNAMHRNSNGYMLDNGSYMDAIYKVRR